MRSPAGIARTLRGRFGERETPTTMAQQYVSGRRSPRWAIWSRLLVPCQNGDQYLARLRLIQTPWFGVYLHDIYEPDGDRDPHNHPWSFVSVVLRGRYVERVYPTPDATKTPLTSHHYEVHEHRRFSAHRMGRGAAHRITYAAPGLKTLILTGPRGPGWGFFRHGEFIPWERYEREIGTLA